MPANGVERRCIEWQYFAMRFRFACVFTSLLVAACSSSNGSNDQSQDSGLVDTTPADTFDSAPPAPYQVPLFDNTHIGSDSSKPDFQKAAVDLAPLHDAPYANVTLVIDLTSPCYPWSNWKTDPPPSGQNWPADCDAFDRNFETWLVDPSAPKTDPSFELVRAITPFGGPEHIEEDVTDFFNALAKSNDTKTRSLEIHITTWSDSAGKVSGSNGGWFVSAHLEVTPGDAPANALAAIALYNAGWDSKSTAVTVPFTLPAGTTSARIEYRVTGHGGASTSDTACIGPADEFCRRTHHVMLDGASLKDVTPWRTNCAKLCTLTPGAPFGSYCLENPCGLPASVRASRANWCPGSETPPIDFTPTTLTAPGDHTWGFSIDNVPDGASWRVSATVIAFGS
jgi:hypothetical protein